MSAPARAACGWNRRRGGYQVKTNGVIVYDYNRFDLEVKDALDLLGKKRRWTAKMTYTAIRSGELMLGVLAKCPCLDDR